MEEPGQRETVGEGGLPNLPQWLPTIVVRFVAIGTVLTSHTIWDR